FGRRLWQCDSGGATPGDHRGGSAREPRHLRESPLKVMTKISLPEIRHAGEAAQAETAKFLCDLIRFPSLSGQEEGAVDCAAARFAEVAEVERVPLASTLRKDED